jgi:phosphoglycolate phosphatase-like HAD superfamily hydrolase
MQTTNAGMGAVGVSWGYRPKEELLADGAIHI